MTKSARTRIADRIRANTWAFLDDMDKLPGEPTLVPDRFSKTKARYHFIDNQSDILCIAHCDSVARNKFVTIKDGILSSPSLDNRIGVYMALVELPVRGIKCDVLLTEGEESCDSTAQYFKTDKKYNWIFSFDRMGYDCALYQYLDDTTKDAVKRHGYTPVHGSYSDIVELDTLGCKGFNFGIGYRDYHSDKSNIHIGDLVTLTNMFVSFHSEMRNEYMPHKTSNHYFGRNRYSWPAYKPYTSTYKYSGNYAPTRSSWRISTRVQNDGKSLTVDYSPSDSASFAHAYRDTTMSDDGYSHIGGVETWDEAPDGAFAPNVSAILCDNCHELHHPHDITFDFDTESMLCHRCYDLVNSIDSARRRDADVPKMCEMCMSETEDAKLRRTDMGTFSLCESCYTDLVSMGHVSVNGR